MRVPSINEPLRLGREFWVIFCVLAIPSLWLIKPWTWEGPVISRLVGGVLPPFLSAIVLYSVVLFTASLLKNVRGQKRALAEFSVAILGPTAFLIAAWIFSGYDKLPAVCAFIASFIGYSLLAWMHLKRPNKALEPTPTSVTPPAAQESRRP